MFSSALFFLTKSSTFIIGDIAKVFGYLMDAIYNFFGQTFGIYSLGLSIIIFTIITRLLLLPLAFKQQKSMKETQLIQPELKAIQDKYKNKKDQENQQKMQAEISALYQKHGVNPFGGCLPLLIQMPIIFSLFAVLRNIPAYISNIKVYYTDIVTSVQAVPNYMDGLNTLLESEKKVLAGSKLVENSTDSIIDLLYRFQTTTWEAFYAIYPSIQAPVSEIVSQLDKIYSMFGINLADTPDLLSIGILIPVLNTVASYISMKTSTSTNTAQVDSQANQMNKSMMYTMPLMSGFFAITMPSGLGLYWLAGSCFQIGQQWVINKHIHKELDKKIVKK
jgi:YidC/Oxa1 family membrane protein insertase